MMIEIMVTTKRVMTIVAITAMIIRSALTGEEGLGKGVVNSGGAVDTSEGAVISAVDLGEGVDISLFGKVVNSSGVH